MNLNRFHYVAAITLASLIGFLPLGLAAAGSFTITPGKEEVSLAPGAAVIKKMTVVNNLGRPATFDFNLEAIAGSDKAGEAVKFLPGRTNQYALQNFITLPIKTLILKAGESQVIPVAIEVPPHTPPGGYFGAITVAVASDNSAATKINARVASLWFVTVTGPAKNLGHLINFGPLGSGWQFWSKELRFQYSFNNEGNTYLNPYGGIELHPRLAWGFTRSIIVPPNFVLPGSTRLFEIKAPAGTFCGWYKITLKLNRGYDNVIDEQSANLITCGRSFSLIIIFGVIIVIGLGSWLVVKLKRVKNKI